MNNTETYFNTHTPWYGDKTFGRVRVFLRSRATTESSLLDVGCADGELLLGLRRRISFPGELAGLDVAENYLAQCRTVLPDCKFYLGAIDDPNVVQTIGRQFTYVTMGSVLHHVVGKTRRASRNLATQSLQNAWALVAPGGALAVVEPTFTPAFPMTMLFYLKRFFSIFTKNRIVLLNRFDNNIGPPIVAYLLPKQLYAMCQALPGGQIVSEKQVPGTVTPGWHRLGIRKRILLTLIIQKDA